MTDAAWQDEDHDFDLDDTLEDEADEEDEGYSLDSVIDHLKESRSDLASNANLDDPYIRGEYDVLSAAIKYLRQARAAFALIDKARAKSPAATATEASDQARQPSKSALLGALIRLRNAAFSRDVTMGDPLSLLAAQSELDAARKHADIVIKEASRGLSEKHQRPSHPNSLPNGNLMDTRHSEPLDEANHDNTQRRAP